MILDGIDHQEKVAKPVSPSSIFSSLSNMETTPIDQSDPAALSVGFRSCICNTKRTSHAQNSLGIEVLRAWSRR